MKKLSFFIAMLLLFSSATFAQVGINSDNSAPNSSAGLDVNFNNKGFLPPRMSTTQINAIVTPAEGLMVYNISVHSPVYYDGNGWKRTDGQFYIGASYGGGIIFYIDGTGQHGLISTTSDQSTGAQWGCINISIPGTSSFIGTGQANTTAIVTQCGTVGIAAQICDALVLNGYSDWFLPSKDELNQMYLQKSIIGGFGGNLYWSSYEYDCALAWIQYFEEYGAQDYYWKDTACYVRAVRAF